MSGEKLTIHNYVAISSVIILLVMTVLDVSLVNVALPVLGKEFGVSESATVWLVTIYQLIIVMLLLPLSSIGDQYSYKRNFMAGLTVFTVGSGLCALSQDFSMLLVSRAVQSLGAAGVMSVNIALTRLIYTRHILGRGLALNAVFIGVATAAGPSLGGWILSSASWHWLFIINIPFGIIAFFIGLKTLPDNPSRPEKPVLDRVGSLLNIIFFGLLFYSLGNITDRGQTVVCVILLLLAVAVGFFYLRRELAKPHPMLPVDLFRNRLYSTSILTSTSSFIAQNITIISLPFLFLSVLKLSELTTGFVMTPWPVATMIFSPFAARWIERHNAAFTAAFGMILFIIGLFLLIFIPENANVVDIVWRMAVCGIGYGFFQTPNNIVMVMATPVERTGAAGGMQSTARLTGQTFGSTLVGIIFAVVAVTDMAVQTCLWTAMGFAVIACVFSFDRGHQITKNSTSL